MDDCSAPLKARGLCQRHYVRLLNHGDPSVLKVPRGDALARMRYYGWTVTPEGCWEWNGRRNNEGYGQLEYRRKATRAHRVAYMAWVGPIPEGMLIRHTCDNPPCINPDHLTPGTNHDNTMDKVARKRLGRVAILDEDDVRAIRAGLARGVSAASLARAYGVHQTTISNIRTGKRWSHVA